MIDKYGISVLVSLTSFGGETSCGVAKCLLFSQSLWIVTLLLISCLVVIGLKPEFFLIKIKKIKFGREKPLVKFIYSNNHRQSVCSCLHPKAGIVTRCKHWCFSLFISFFRDRSGTRQRGRNMAWNEQRWKIWSDHKLQTSAKVYESPGTWERPPRARFFKGR